MENENKVIEEEVKTQEDAPKETLGDEKFDLVELLSGPAVSALLGCGKELFKKEKTDPNVCEISIKAPSEVVLKLFNISDKK